MSITAMKLALAALEDHSAIKHPQQRHYRDTAITALRQAIAEKALNVKAENARELGLNYEPEQEPVAWIYQNLYTEDRYLVWSKQTGGRNWQPLYTTPHGTGEKE